MGASIAWAPLYRRSMIRRSLWWLAGLWLSCVAGAAGIYLLFIRTATGQRLDMAALSATDALPGAVVVDAGTFLDAIGISTLAVIAFVIGGLALTRGRYALAFAAAVVVVGSNVTTQILKGSLLERPLLVQDLPFHPNSYPSGHATVAASLAVAAFLVVSHRVRAPVALTATVFAAAVGVSTVVAGWHRPSDVIGAWLVVGSWGALATGVLLAARGSTVAPERDRWRTRGEMALLVGGVGALGVFLATTGGWMWLRVANPDGLAWLTTGMALAVAASGIVGSSLAVAGGLVFAVRRLTFEPA